MNTFHLEEIIETEELTEFTLPHGHVLVWRDSTPAQIMFLKDQNKLPLNWRSDDQCCLKILGNFEEIKALFPDFNIPGGSKVIGLESGAQIQVDTKNKILRFHGKRKKRVVVVDDSSTIRKLLKHIISHFNDWEIVAEIESAEEIPAALNKFCPDLVTLDLNLGKVNGAQAMKNYLAPKRIPTLLITSQPKKDGGLVMDALAAGAMDYLQKPESGQWESMREELHLKMETALKSKWQTTTVASGSSSPIQFHKDFLPQDYLVTIGSSTGGTQALQEILTRLPEKIPPIIITQHIPAGFSRALAERLNDLCPFEIKEAENGDEIKPGRVLIAPGDHHMKVSKSGNTVEVFAGEPVNRFRPSVEVMFNSVRAHSKVKVVAIMLTGMGKDGAEAMLGLKKANAYTIAQDEASCVVFGMPKEAIRLGAVDEIKPLLEIPDLLCRYFAGQKKVRKSG